MSLRNTGALEKSQYKDASGSPGGVPINVDRNPAAERTCSRARLVLKRAILE
jgi:hypothetical protein